VTYHDDFPSILFVDPVGRWTGFGGMPSSEAAVGLVLVSVLTATSGIEGKSS
jgi:hypothetical protein